MNSESGLRRVRRGSEWWTEASGEEGQVTLHQPIRRYWSQHNPRIDGTKVPQPRLDAGMTQKQLAEAIGVSERTIRISETVEGPMLDAPSIASRLARVFGVGRGELYALREAADCPASRR